MGKNTLTQKNAELQKMNDALRCQIEELQHKNQVLSDILDFADCIPQFNIETIEICGFVSAFKALRLPFSLPERSSSIVDIHQRVTAFGENAIHCESDIIIDKNDMSRMQNLIANGDEHAKVVRGIQVYAKISAPLYWWSELETYTIGHTRLASSSTMHVDCKKLRGRELQHKKSVIPSAKTMTKIDCFSYQTLRRIVVQRFIHRLPEWHSFIDWIKTLPFANELILCGLEDKLKIHNETDWTK